MRKVKLQAERGPQVRESWTEAFPLCVLRESQTLASTGWDDVQKLPSPSMGEHHRGSLALPIHPEKVPSTTEGRSVLADF